MKIPTRAAGRYPEFLGVTNLYLKHPLIIRLMHGRRPKLLADTLTFLESKVIEIVEDHESQLERQVGRLHRRGKSCV